jgi:hypothetical protein
MSLRLGEVETLVLAAASWSRWGGCRARLERVLRLLLDPVRKRHRVFGGRRGAVTFCEAVLTEPQPQSAHLPLAPYVLLWNPRPGVAGAVVAGAGVACVACQPQCQCRAGCHRPAGQGLEVGRHGGRVDEGIAPIVHLDHLGQQFGANAVAIAGYGVDGERPDLHRQATSGAGSGRRAGGAPQGPCRR